MVWNCIAFTCPNIDWGEAIEKELEILKNEDKIDKDTITIVIEDPAPDIGSGGATLNALLVVAERLSVDLGFPVISSEALTDARILMLHVGRFVPYDPCGKIFTTLPDNMNEPVSMITNLERLLQIVGKLQNCFPPGLWVCSTDMVLDLSNEDIEALDFKNDAEGVMFCLPTNVDYALNHGTVVLDDNMYVEKILYGVSREQLQIHSDENGIVPLLSGIVFLSTQIAEVLLSFHELSPLDCCTYMGIDSGAENLRISLFFDILIAMSSKITKEDFMHGNCGKAYNKKFFSAKSSETEDILEIGRKIVWDTLSKYRLKGMLLKKGAHNYLSELEPATHHIGILKNFIHSNAYHLIHDVNKRLINSVISSDNCLIGDDSIVQHCSIDAISFETGNNSYLSSILVKKFQGHLGDRTIIINSEMVGSFSCEDDCFLQHCKLFGSLTLGKNCYLSSVKMEETEEFTLQKDFIWVQFPCKNSSQNETFSCDLILGNIDNINLGLEENSSKIFNETWNCFFKRTGITIEDLWPSSLVKKTLLNAKLFPKTRNLVVLQWLHSDPNNEGASRIFLCKWKEMQRVSIEDLMYWLNPALVLDFRRQIMCDVTCQVISSALLKNQDLYLLPYFKFGCSQGWPLKILDCLDLVADKLFLHEKSPVNLKRVIFCIADLLGCMGGNRVGLRSGPAGNVSWISAFSLIECGLYRESMHEMALKRKNWMNKPELLLRAARHYEKAALNMIQIDIASAAQLIKLKDTKLPAVEDWVISECPARVDVMGGWTDTPPQCYELKGSVVDISFKLNGKRPIGSKGKRIDRLQIVLVLHSEGFLDKSIIVNSIDDIMDYSRPNSPAALLKAAIIATSIIDNKCSATLQDQLQKNLGSGLELHSWARVPQGSGLGTSTILAGAICSTLWTLSGKAFTRKDLIHVVLVVEQLLTTGGGWQDGAAGISGGICNGKSEKGLPVEVNVDLINLPENHIDILNRHIILIYTGKVRLARNILQNTIRNWYAREDSVLNRFKEMLSSIDATIKSLLECDLITFGALITRYWELKKTVAPGSEPTRIRKMIKLLEPYTHGQTMAGAGGGGFLCIVTKEPNYSEKIADVLEEAGYTDAIVYSSTIDMDGIFVQVNGSVVDIPHF